MTAIADELAHGRAGQLGHMADASSKPPKWRMTRTLRQGYLLAAVWLIIGLPLATFWASGSFSRWLRLGVGVFATNLVVVRHGGQIGVPYLRRSPHEVDLISIASRPGRWLSGRCR